MQRIQIGTRMQQQEPTVVFYDLGQHTLEGTDEGGILIAAHGSSTALFKEAVQLDQDETYHLFLVLAAQFRENGLPAKGSEPCS